MPLLFLLVLFIGLPLFELYFLIKMGSVIGALPTIGLSILTAVIGSWLVRRQGLSVLMRVREAMDRGETPALEMIDGALLLVGGLMLLFPGFLTDAAGFLLLVPPIRKLLVKRVVVINPAGQAPRESYRSVERVIEGEYHRDD